MEENANILEKTNTSPNIKDINTRHHLQKLLFTRMCGVISCNRCEEKYLKMWLNTVGKILQQTLNGCQFSFIQPTRTIVGPKNSLLLKRNLLNPREE
jgi:hypothetical protein